MSGSHLLIGALLLGLTSSCSPEAASVYVDAERAALTQADQSYTQFATGNDSENIIGLYATDAIIYPPHSAAVNGLDGVRGFVDEFTSIPDLSLNFQPWVIEVSKSGDMGYTINMVDITSPDSLGNPVTIAHRDVHTWGKDDNGSWKVMVDIWNEE